jgi:hypothetical protein
MIIGDRLRDLRDEKNLSQGDIEIPLYQLFYDGEQPPQLPNLPKRKSSANIAWGSSRDARFLRRLLSKADEGGIASFPCIWHKKWLGASFTISNAPLRDPRHNYTLLATSVF